MENEDKTNIFENEYSKFEKAEIITHLSKLLNNYLVHVHKLKYYSWNVIGRDHFELRKRFLDCRNHALRQMDRIAIRLGLFNFEISDSWDTILKTSEIKEGPGSLTGFEMVKTLVGDLLILLSILEECVKKANEIGDYGTEIMTRELMYELEQEYHGFFNWLK